MMAGAMVIAALVVTFVSKEKEQEELNSQLSSAISNGSSNKEVEGTLNEAGDLVINPEDIEEEATFFQLKVKGTDMAVLAVKAEDGTIRTAFDTCQICNGSPYAYFEQQGDSFQCQNCGNVYSSDMIEKERGGCNPVPIMADEKIETESEIIIPAKVLEDNLQRFEIWKKI